jgi:CMP-N-acetylneuraminic acid synthetase
MKQGKFLTVVPSRLGSNRVPMKGMRLLGGVTLLEHTLNAIKSSKHLGEGIYINSDAIQWKEIANKLGVNFYHRRAELATSTSMIDDYLYDFMKTVPSDFLAVITPTAPFITGKIIDEAIQTYLESEANTLISCEKIQTHCFFNGQSLNFSCSGQLPRSQDLQPVHALNFSIALYDTKKFMASYEANGFAVLSGDILTYPLEGFATIDIDEEDDFIRAELAIKFKEAQTSYQPSYSEFVQDLISTGKDTRN